MPPLALIFTRGGECGCCWVRAPAGSTQAGQGPAKKQKGNGDDEKALAMASAMNGKETRENDHQDLVEDYLLEQSNEGLFAVSARVPLGGLASAVDNAAHMWSVRNRAVARKQVPEVEAPPPTHQQVRPHPSPECIAHPREGTYAHTLGVPRVQRCIHAERAARGRPAGDPRSIRGRSAGRPVIDTCAVRPPLRL